MMAWPVVPDEIRAAVALYGGVALAVYEAGVAHEMYRAVRGDGVYAAALGSGRRFVMDVIAGTSAGGITGGLLAHALAAGTDLTAMRRLWVRQGDLASLLHRHGGPVPSLLDGERLRALISAALAGGCDTPLVDDLVATLTATDLTGRPVWFLDSLGHRVLATTARAHETFTLAQLRGQQADMSEGRAAVPERLVEFMCATSALPGAFAPRRIDERWYADGGILDNRPLGLALRGIQDRLTCAREHRLLIFVEPHPEVEATPFPPSPVPHAIETAARAIGLALEDSVLEDLRGIDEVNMRAEW